MIQSHYKKLYAVCAIATLAIALLFGSHAAYAVTGPSNCSWVSHPNDCIATGTCACIKATKTLTIRPPDTTVSVSSAQSTSSTLNPVCKIVTNTQGADAVVFFKFANEWNPGYQASLFANLAAAGLIVADCNSYVANNVNYPPCTAACGGGQCTTNLITTGPLAWTCTRIDKSTDPPSTYSATQADCINAGQAPDPTYTFENDDKCYTGTWTPGDCSDTCGGGTILPPTCSDGPGKCDPSTKPDSGQACNTQTCPANGVCGSANGSPSGIVSFDFGAYGGSGTMQTPAPSGSALCSSGSATTPTVGNGIWSWSCQGGGGNSNNASCSTSALCPGNNTLTESMETYQAGGSVGDVGILFKSCCGTVCTTGQGPVVGFGQGGITGCSGTGGPNPCPTH